MPTFTPPIHFNGPRYALEEVPVMKRCLSFFRPSPIGINVWVLKDEFVNGSWSKVSVVQPPSNDWVEREYLGARTHQVTEDEASVLASAGFVTEE